MRPDWATLLAQATKAPEPADFLEGRLVSRTYTSRSFPLGLPQSSDFQQPACTVWKVFDQDSSDLDSSQPCDEEEYIVTTSPGGRVQIAVQVVRQTGAVRELVLQHVKNRADGTRTVADLLRLDREASARLLEFVKQIEFTDPADNPGGSVTDNGVLAGLSEDPEALAQLYKLNPEMIRSIIRADPDAGDILGLAYRREQLEIFRQMLEDSESYDESSWQRFFEANSWVLGVSLSTQLLTSWDPDKLEKVVAGQSVAGVGKRNDALMKTSGAIQSFVLVEIKKPSTDLLDNSPYRSGCWAPSRELAGGVTQIQQTSHLASENIRTKLESTDGDGFPTGEYTYMLQPKTFLVVGHLESLQNDGGHIHEDKLRSFEIYRRNLVEPTILTFDEILVRAEWQLEFAERIEPDEGGVPE